MKGDRAAMLRRIALEKRAIVLPLAVALLVNLAAYAFVVYPLRVRAAGAEQRAEAARTALHVAEQQRETARATLVGKERAEQELGRFYSKVLPDSYSSAHRVLYLRIRQLARDAGVQYQRANIEEEKETDKRAGDVRKLTESVQLEGSYENVRRFIYSLETASDFVVIENVSLAARSQGNAGLTLTLVLSTYYRPGGNAA